MEGPATASRLVNQLSSLFPGWPGCERWLLFGQKKPPEPGAVQGAGPPITTCCAHQLPVSADVGDSSAGQPGSQGRQNLT
jgi:hypothetical protein